MTIKELALLASKELSDRKANDIKIIEISEKASFADYLVIATGSTERQINNLVDYVEDALAKEEIFAKSIEGKQTSGWILIDFGDIIVNLFTPETREKYNLEKVWRDCPTIDAE